MSFFICAFTSSRHHLFHHTWIWSCYICNWPAVIFSLTFTGIFLKYYPNFLMELDFVTEGVSTAWFLYFWMSFHICFNPRIGTKHWMYDFRAVSFAKSFLIYLLSTIVCLKIFILFTQHNKFMFFGLSLNPVWNPFYFWSYEDWILLLVDWLSLHLSSVVLQPDHLCFAVTTFWNLKHCMTFYVLIYPYIQSNINIWETTFFFTPNAQF